MLAARVINAVSLFVFSVAMARTLGTDRYGLIALAVGVAGIFEVVGALGMNTGATRYIPFYQARGEEDDVRRVVSINVTAKLGASVMLAVLLYLLAGLLADFFDKPVEPLMRIAALVLGLNILGGALQGLLRGLQRLGAMAVSQASRDVVWLGTSLGLVVFSDWGPDGALWGYAAGAAVWVVVLTITTALGLRADVPSTRPLKRRFDPRVTKALITFGVPVLLTNLLFLIFEWTDTFVIAFYLPTEDLSVYNVAFGVVSMPLVLTIAIGMAMLPAMSQAFGAGRMGLLRTLWGGALKIVDLVLYPVAMLLLVLSAPVVVLLYGEAFADAAVPLSMLAVWLFFRPTGALSGQLLASMALQVLVLVANLVAVVLNVVLCIALVPEFGIVGAASATTTSFFVNAVIMYNYARKHGEVRLDWRGKGLTIAASLLAAVIAAALFVATAPIGEEPVGLLIRLVVAAGVALGAYIGAIRALRVVSEEELEDIRTVAERSNLVKLVLRFLS
jgi:O-antigen/teichoic acid export membrane protein